MQAPDTPDSRGNFLVCKPFLLNAFILRCKDRVSVSKACWTSFQVKMISAHLKRPGDFTVRWTLRKV